MRWVLVRQYYKVWVLFLIIVRSLEYLNDVGLSMSCFVMYNYLDKRIRVRLKLRDVNVMDKMVLKM